MVVLPLIVLMMMLFIVSSITKTLIYGAHYGAYNVVFMVYKGNIGGFYDGL